VYVLHLNVSEQLLNLDNLKAVSHLRDRLYGVYMLFSLNVSGVGIRKYVELVPLIATYGFLRTCHF
jgi:hypothetical protein